MKCEVKDRDETDDVRSRENWRLPGKNVPETRDVDMGLSRYDN